jgi:hypothetical protein
LIESVPPSQLLVTLNTQPLQPSQKLRNQKNQQKTRRLRSRCCTNGTYLNANPEYYNVALGETGLAVRTLPPSARRSIAALWFAVFAALATFLFFLRLVMAPHAVILYILLPSLAAGIAGYFWGGSLLDSSQVQNYGYAVLRGFIVGAATFVIFAALYACVLPTLEGQWSLGRVGSLFLLTLMLGILMGGPLAAVTGMTAGVALYKFGRHFFAESGGRPSEASTD